MQGMLLEAGLARAYSYRDNRSCMKQMLALENTARQKHTGLWRYKLFRPQQAKRLQQLQRKKYHFTLVEGKVRKISHVKSWVFLNFGDQWRNDFTIAIKRKYSHKMHQNGYDIDKLQDRNVRVRGWIERWNGPMIKVTHKEQIEVLSESPEAGNQRKLVATQ